MATQATKAQYLQQIAETTQRIITETDKITAVNVATGLRQATNEEYKQYLEEHP